MAKPQKKSAPEKKKSVPIKKILPPQKINYLFPSLIAIIAFGLYFNTLHHEYVLDDAVAITHNQFVQQGTAGIGGLLTVDFWHFSNLSLGYYRPLALITFAVEHQLFGNNPHISHLINIMLYAFSGFMLCLLLMELFRGYQQLFAFLVCLLFIAFPTHTEVVANLKSRDEILSFLGIVSVLFLMVRYDGSGKRIYFMVSLVIYYLAMLSKETAITGAALLPLCLYFFKNKSIVDSIKKTIPFIIVVGIFYIQKLSILGSVSEKSFFEINNYPYIHEKFTSSMIIFAYCLKLLAYPHPLMYDYSYNQIPAGSWINMYTWLGLALFCGLLFLAVKGFLQKKMWGFALAVFFITLLPAMAFVWLRGGIMAERFLYAPSLGLSIALVYLFTLLIKSQAGKGAMDYWNNVKPASETGKHSGIPLFDSVNVKILALVVVVFLAYSFKTVDRNKAWHDNMTLFSTDVVNATNSCQNNRHYGHELLEKAMAEKKDTLKRKEYLNQALPYLRKAVAINPRFGEVWGDLGRSYYDITFVPDSAIYFFRTAIDVTPNAAIDYSNLGLVYLSLGKNKLASFYFNMACAINPNFTDARQRSDEIRKATGLDVTEYPGGENPALANLQLPTLTVPNRNRQ